jgi:hypothetical protein
MQSQKKILILLPFKKEVLDVVVRHEAYSFLDGFQGYHQIMIVPKDLVQDNIHKNWGTFE